MARLLAPLVFLMKLALADHGGRRGIETGQGALAAVLLERY